MSNRPSLMALALGIAGTIVAIVPAGTANAAPVPSRPGQTFAAICDGNKVSLYSAPGAGPLSPFRMVTTGQVLIPTEFELLNGDQELKSRHFGPEPVVTKPGHLSGSTTCLIWDPAQATDGTEFLAVVTGVLVGP